MKCQYHKATHILLILCFFQSLVIASCKGVERRPPGSFLPRREVGTQHVPSVRGDHLEQVSLSSLLSVTDHGLGVTDAGVIHRGGAVSTLLPSVNELKGSVIFLALDHFFRVLFKKNGISFPSQLGGCCILFALMILAEIVKPGVGDSVFSYLSPGAGLLARWIAVFFVPGLAMLPNAPSMGSALEVFKVLLVVVVGFYYSAATTAYAVLGLRKMQGSVTTASVSKNTKGPASKPYSTELVDLLLKSFVLTGALSVGASLAGNEFAVPLRTLFMTITAFFGYVWGARLPAAFTKIVHPLVTSTAVTLLATQSLAMATGGQFNQVLASYKVGSIHPMKAGAGDILLYLLGPTVVSFAIAVYSRKDKIAENFLTVMTSMMVGSAGGLFGTAAFVRLLKLGGEGGSVLRKSMLPRNVTTPLAIAITQIINGNVPQACAVVVLTGIFGATFGAAFMDFLGITDPVSRGMGIGASGQGLGVASIMHETEAFPFAAVSMVLTAVAATTLVSIPAVANAVVNLACGN